MIAAISASAVVAMGVIVGFYMWKNRTIEKKRKGRTLT